MNISEVARKHQRRIALDTMRMVCAFARIAGGMDHVEAAAFLKVAPPRGCTCKK